MIHAIRTPSDAAVAMDYFNGFHDGCLVSLALAWDAFLDDDTSLLLPTGASANLVFSHYNYVSARTPYHENVRMALKEVSDVRMDFSQFKEWDWAISEVRITSPNNSPSAPLTLSCTWCYLAGHEWQTKEALQLRFCEAEIWDHE